VFIRLVAGIIDVPFDSLWNRERRRKRRQRISAAAGIFGACLILFAGFAHLQNQFDVNALMGRSFDISREGWQNAWRPAFFEPSLRAAIGATALQDSALSGMRAGACDLSKAVDTAACVLALSGLSIRSSLIFGNVPSTEQANIRNHVRRNRRALPANGSARCPAPSSRIHGTWPGILRQLDLIEERRRQRGDCREATPEQLEDGRRAFEEAIERIRAERQAIRDFSDAYERERAERAA